MFKPFETPQMLTASQFIQAARAAGADSLNIMNDPESLAVLEEMEKKQATDKDDEQKPETD